MNLPRISIITPSFNQADFLERTIESVLSQGYQNLEYLILDGGSTDGSVEIIRRYEKLLTFWCSETDGGPWSAILNGAARCSGSWFNWLNSDDLLLPGSLALLAELIEKNPNAQWISGARLDIDCNGRPVGSSCPWLRNPNTLIFAEPFLPQDATFIQLDLFRAVAPSVPADLTNLFDTVLHRLLWAKEKPLLTTAMFSAMRWHPSQRTAMNDQRADEASRPDVLASALPRSMLQSALQRMSSTRLHRLVEGVGWQLASAGAFGLDDLKTSVYDPWSQRFIAGSAAEAIARSQV